MTDVMGAMKAQAGQGPKMNSLQIIQKSAEHELPPGMNMQKFLSGVAHMIKSPHTKLVQIGNSVFLVQLKAQGTVEVHTFSAEQSPKALVENYKGLAKLLKNEGIKHATSYSPRPEYARIAQMTGLPVKISQTQKMIAGKMVPVQQFDMDL